MAAPHDHVQSLAVVLLNQNIFKLIRDDDDDRCNVFVALGGDSGFCASGFEAEGSPCQDRNLAKHFRDCSIYQEVSAFPLFKRNTKVPPVFEFLFSSP
jgi:hypothetical protein